MAGIIGAKHRQVGRSELTIFSEKEKNPKSWPKWANLHFFWCQNLPSIFTSASCESGFFFWLWRCLHLSLHGGWTLADTDTPRKEGHIQPVFSFWPVFCFKISRFSMESINLFFLVNEVIYFETQKKNTKIIQHTPPKQTWVFQAATFHSSSMLARPNKNLRPTQDSWVDADPSSPAFKTQASLELIGKLRLPKVCLDPSGRLWFPRVGGWKLISPQISWWSDHLPKTREHSFWISCFFKRKVSGYRTCRHYHKVFNIHILL